MLTNKSDFNFQYDFVISDALAKLGFKLSTPVLSSLTLRYANKKGQVNIDDFLQICCRVKSSFGNYRFYFSYYFYCCLFF